MRSIFSRLGAVLLLLATLHAGAYPMQRPVRKTPVPPEGNYTVHLDQPQQIIKGLGFEIQSDSIASGNKGISDDMTSVPHDLTPDERTRFYNEMLKGFRYMRLAGGLYWRGLDADKKQLQGRWPEQLPELRDLIKQSGVEGVSFEYWSPAPYWKANNSLAGWQGKGTQNVLRCFTKEFKNDPVYHGDEARFLSDFAQACRKDLQTLKDAGIPVSLWGLQNEPFADTPYSSCVYWPTTYARTFLAVAPVIRALDPNIKIIADTSGSWKFGYIRSVLDNPATASLVDYLVIHHVGTNSNDEFPPPETSGKPRYQNEYEYLDGVASPDRCLNTAQDIMNWFQVAKAPTWFWIHALKPIGNSEGSGYALGFWHPQHEETPSTNPKFADLQPGHWTYNNYNWFAVGSFLRHMPWNCQAFNVTEQVRDNDLRILAFKKPDGKLTVVLSNRSGSPHIFHVDTGLKDAVFKGWRYSPTDAGENCQGVPITDTQTGGTISPQLQDRTWEFWEQQ